MLTEATVSPELIKNLQEQIVLLDSRVDSISTGNLLDSLVLKNEQISLLTSQNELLSHFQDQVLGFVNTGVGLIIALAVFVIGGNMLNTFYNKKKMKRRINSGLKELKDLVDHKLSVVRKKFQEIDDNLKELNIDNKKFTASIGFDRTLRSIDQQIGNKQFWIALDMLNQTLHQNIVSPYLGYSEKMEIVKRYGNLSVMIVTISSLLKLVTINRLQMLKTDNGILSKMVDDIIDQFSGIQEIETDDLKKGGS